MIYRHGHLHYDEAAMPATDVVKPPLHREGVDCATTLLALVIALGLAAPLLWQLVVGAQ